jgi:hypothetical protein
MLLSRLQLAARPRVLVVVVMSGREELGAVLAAAV